MSKRLILVLALAFVLGVSFAAYAEVQNVKVSGDLTVEGVARDNFDLVKTPVMGATGIQNPTYDDKNRDILSIIRVRVDADLTDNVMTTVRLLNERNWNGESQTPGQANRNIGLNTATTTNEDRIDIDLAYVTLKEFLYSPLSLTVGRQELHFGNELIVGDPDTNIYSALTQLSEGDLSTRKAFDAVRATLDYNPLVVDAIYAKIQGGLANQHDDVTLTGVNANYALNKNTTLEGFFFSKVTGTDAAEVYHVDTNNNTSFTGNTVSPLKMHADQVHTIGARVVDKTVKNLSVDAQVAYQFGTYNPKFDPNARYLTAANSRDTAKRSAWAAQAMATYDFKDVPVLSRYMSKYAPSLSATYTFLSGADRNRISDKAYKGWDPMFENQTIGHIMNAIFANTNMRRGSLSAKAKVTDDITANLAYAGAWFSKHYPDGTKAILSGVAGSSAATSGRQFVLAKAGYIGQELDATLTYDYTEDVQFSLLGGVFMPGKNIHGNLADNNNNNIASATELIGSMKVTF